MVTSASPSSSPNQSASSYGGGEWDGMGRDGGGTELLVEVAAQAVEEGEGTMEVAEPGENARHAALCEGQSLCWHSLEQ